MPFLTLSFPSVFFKSYRITLYDESLVVLHTRLQDVFIAFDEDFAKLSPVHV